MKTVLSKLSEMTTDAFAWDEYQSNPFEALTSAGLDLDLALETLADLQRRSIPKPHEAWQSCDACFDPGSDDDPFDGPHAD
jgi:hypothetical protein